jgi:hypothetical protein
MNTVTELADHVLEATGRSPVPLALSTAQALAA